MQSSTYAAVKGNAAFAFQRRSFFSNLVSRSATTTTGIRFKPLHSSASKAMGAKLARAENGIHSLSSVKARSGRAQASSGSSLILLWLLLSNFLLDYIDVCLLTFGVDHLMMMIEL